MIKIAICDDDVLELERSEKYINKYMENNPDIQIAVTTFLSPLELLSCVDVNAGFDIYILDIIMDGMKGTEVARELRNKQISCEIIFMTTSREYAVDAFALNAIHYLVKPYDYVDFSEALARALKKTELADNNYIVKNTDKGVTKIPVSNICYSESSGHYQYIHMNNKEVYKVRSKVVDLWQELQVFSQFIKPHAGFIVNMEYIKNITSSEIELVDQIIPLTKNTYTKVRKQYMDFIFKK